MANFAKSNAVINITNMGHVAQSVARNSLTNVQEIPREVINSMDMQGMINNQAFNPGMPINPTQPLGSEPRQFEYMVGQNIVQRPRSTEAVGFDTMRSLVEMYDIAQMCIEVRQDELRNLEWDIVPADEDDKNAETKYSSEIKQIKEFFKKPDGYTSFDDFQNQLSYDWLVYDAPAIFPHATRGGKLGALEVVDGTTITPMVDFFGRTPVAPAPAYVQWAYGLPWVWLNREELIYRPHRRRTNKLYGYPAIEWLLTTINTDIRHQLYFLQYFTEGSVPEAWVQAPAGTNPKHIKEIQDIYDAVMVGDQTQKHKVKWIPAGSAVTQAKDTKFDVAFPQFMLSKTCAAFKVQPAEIGFTEKVNKSSGETQENVQYRRSIKPSATFFQSIYTGIIHKYFNQPNLKFKFLNIEEQEDLLLMAQRDDIYIKNGTMSPDEVRVKRLGMKVDDSNPVPRGFYTTREGFIPVQDAIAKSKASLLQVQAQTDELRVKAGESPEDNTSTSSNSPEVVETEEEENDANKAAKDFFISPVERKNSLNLQTK